jgi:hypothetical protein
MKAQRDRWNQPRRPVALAAAALAAILAATGLATSAVAAEATKARVLLSWTKPTSLSYTAWDTARQHQLSWSRYHFDWTTDLCSASPDTPLGFDFRMPCWRHDFGYRNYKEIGEFPANKDRVDRGFFADLTAVCANYQGMDHRTCSGLASAYYRMVNLFGDAKLTDADVERIAAESREAELSSAK